MLLRKVLDKDIDGISAMYDEFYSYNAGLQPAYYKEAVESGHYPKSVIDSEKSVIFVALENDKIIGFIHADEESTPAYDALVAHQYATVVDLYVTPVFRKKGVGSALINAVKSWAKERDLDYLELFVLTQAENAVRLYKRNGFSTTSFHMRCPL